MSRRKRGKLVSLAVFVALLVLASLSIWQGAGPRKPSPIPSGDYAYAASYAERRIRRLMRQHHLPSMAVAMIDDQEVVWQQSYGWANVEASVPATADTVYKLWSIAKVFTALETMRLVEEGRLDLDAPLTDVLPGFTIQSRFPDSEPITIRTILAHHAGLPRNGCHSISHTPQARDALEKLVDSLRDCLTAYPARYRYKYSNIGPDVLGFLIQTLRGESFSRYMRDSVLVPIGMTSSAFESADLPGTAMIATGYEYFEGNYYPRPQGDIASLPSGNLYSTLEDMAGFVTFLFRGGQHNGKPVVRAETLNLMFEDQFSNRRDPQPMGLGWKTARVLGSERMVWHDGGPSEGIGSLVALLPDRKLGVVLFANEISFEGSLSAPLAVDILETMLETRYGIATPPEQAPRPIRLDLRALDAYAGRYVGFGQVMDVSVSGERLRAGIQGMEFDLIPVGQAEFVVSHWLLKLGLADLLRLPVDLRELKFHFLVGAEDSEAMLFISLGGIAYEPCPKVPPSEEVPASWERLVGAYQVVARLRSGGVGREILGRTEILLDAGLLKMAGAVGPLRPISDTELLILGGPFAGETMVLDSSTGDIYHQAVVYKPEPRNTSRQ